MLKVLTENEMKWLQRPSLPIDAFTATLLVEKNRECDECHQPSSKLKCSRHLYTWSRLIEIKNTLNLEMPFHTRALIRALESARFKNESQ